MTLLCTGLALALCLSACDTRKDLLDPQGQDGPFSLSDVARILSELPLEGEHLLEVHDAVSASSGNGYDEEYMLSDLFTAPGAGVGDEAGATRAGGYKTPLRDLFRDYLSRQYGTKAGGAAEVEHYINALIDSGMQIYWPYSEEWDGVSPPVITYDPGFGAESNFGYEIRFDTDGAHVADSLLVTETLAKRRPVWVINRNDDAAFTPLDFFAPAEEPGTKAGKAKEENEYILKITDIQVNRNFDSWFSGASEIFIKCGSADGFKATKESDLRNFSPSVTDFMIVVKRRQVGKKIPFPTVLLSRYTEQVEDLALMIIEDDGGTTTSWKCSATVKYNSKSYGFEIDLPYKEKDDIIWRGPVSRKMLQPVLDNGSYTLTLGDVSLTICAE